MDAEWTVATLKALVDERHAAMQRALDLQAQEYERRLSELNHAHEKAVEVQHTYVTADKYEQNLESEREKREMALLRVNEQFAEYVKRYEQRQNELDILLAAAKGAAEESKRAAQEQGRKANRNIAIAGVLLTAVIVVMNLLGVGGV